MNAKWHLRVWYFPSPKLPITASDYNGMHHLVQEYDTTERFVHEYSLRGMYRDGAVLSSSSFLTKEWWFSRRFFWERSLNEVPHCVVFVFDGSSDPFLDPEGLEFFQSVFEDCTKMGLCTSLTKLIVFMRLS